MRSGKSCGQIPEQFERALLRLFEHEFLERHLRAGDEFLLADLVRDVRLICRRLNLRNHRGHGEQRQKQGDANQDDVRRVLLKAYGRPQKRKGNDVAREGGHHDHEGRKECDQSGQQKDFYGLDVLSIYIDY